MVLSRVVLFPLQFAENAAGFPIDFTIEVSIDGDTYTTVVTRTGESNEGLHARVYDNARYVRMTCTKRQNVGGTYFIQLAEMAIYGADPIVEPEPTTEVTAEPTTAPTTAPSTEQTTAPTTEPSPATGDYSSFVLIALVLIGSVTFIFVMRRNKSLV